MKQLAVRDNALDVVGDVLSDRKGPVNLRSIDGSFLARFFSLKTASCAYHVRPLFAYSKTEGSIELRRALAELTGLESDEIVITDGASQALWLTLLTTLRAGDRILMPRPVFPAYLRLAAYCGCTCEFYDWQVDGKDLLARLKPAEGSPPSAVIINSPHNPTGLTLGHALCAQVVKHAAQVGCLTIFDDAYACFDPSVDGITRLAPLTHATGVITRLTAVGSLGKSLCLPGLRLGFFASKDRTLCERVVEAKRHLVHSSCPASEELAAAMLTSTAWSAGRQRLGAALDRRRYAFERIARSFGAEPVSGGCGFYVYAARIARLHAAGVEGVPGQVFESNRDEARYCLAAHGTHWARLRALAR